VATTTTHAQMLADLGDLSIEELSQIEVTSVSRRPEPIREAPAAIYVISGDDIRRSGAATLAEALRLAPNLEVARINSPGYAISSRGLNSVNASNKLLALIDGRTIYTPFFSSVFWDQQEVMVADIDRIEVISGPGGTLWGANAMNGVINIITKSSASTQEGLVDAKAGDFLQRAALRWGGKLGDVGTYRTYALGFSQSHTVTPSGADAQDDWNGKQAGFRTDFAVRNDSYTLQGDLYENLLDTPDGRRSGGNFLGRWVRRLADGGSVQVQAYYDEQRRYDAGVTGGAANQWTKTLDVEAEHVFTLRGNHQIVWGIGHRAWRDYFTNTANPFVLEPAAETLNLTNVFAQDTIGLREDLRLVIGSKFEYSTFSGWAVMPNIRLGWQADTRNFLWSAISRAVRSPSRLERDLFAPGIVNPSPNFDSEKLVAYEAGWRAQLSSRATVAVSMFYNDYSDLRTTAPNPVTVLPVNFGNGWEGHTYGADMWASYSPFSWWRLDPGVSLLHKDFHLKPGEQDIAGTQTVLGHDPEYQVFLRSYMDLPNDVQLFVGLRQIAALPDLGIPAYFEADVRVGWAVTPTLELSLVGQNLLHAQHAEGSTFNEIPRSFYVGARWKF
jgi:iron complex outermembrane receptor protein